MARTKVDIGLDIGIASVGWAVVRTDNHEIVKHGARLFDTVDDKKDSSLKNETRRLKRHLRRQYSRIQTRKRDMVKLMVQSGLVSLSNDDFTDKQAALAEFRSKYVQNKELVAKLVKKYGSMYVYEIRAQGAKSPLTKEELIVALYWYASHRGHSYTNVDDKEAPKTKDESDFANLYESKYQGVHPAVAQLSFFKNHFSQGNGNENLPPFLKGSFNRGIKRSAYENELEAILNKNCKLLPNSAFANRFLDLFKRQRDFSEGPGDEKSPTPYGRFFQKDERGNIVKRDKPLENLWDGLIGQCALYPDQPRAPRSAVVGQVFNLLNAINNTRVAGKEEQRFEPATRIELLRIALETKSATKKIAAKMAEELDLPDGASQLILPGLLKPKVKSGTESKEPKLPELTTFHDICKAVPSLKDGAFEKLFHRGHYNINNVYDQIVEALYKYRTVEARHSALSEIFEMEKVSVSAGEMLALANLPIAPKTHGYSFKALAEFVFEMLETGRNGEQIRLSTRDQSVLLNSSELVEKYGKHYLKSDWVHDAIAVPTVRRSVIQTTVVVNALMTFCAQNDYQIEDIVIEMAREKNNKEEREKYEIINSSREEMRKQVRERLGNIQFPSGTLVLKTWLLEQQKCHDAYSAEPIPGANGATGKELEMILRNYEIDHIIPRTQSFDNSRSNSVLTSKTNNSRKGNRTPYQFLGAAKTAALQQKWTTWYRDSNHPFKDKRKLDRLLTQTDYSDVSNQEGFINRNLVDTQYATKELLFAIRSFLKNKGSSTKVKTINGRMTSFLRSRMNKRVRDAEGKLVADPKTSLKRPADVPDSPIDIGKDRTWHGHHAEDAYMITLLNANYVKGKQIEKYFLPNLNKGEARAQAMSHFISENYPEIDAIAEIGRNALNDRMDQICFSRMILRPQNTELFDETIYKGVPLDNGLIQQISKIKILGTGNNIKKIREYFDGSMNSEELNKELYIYGNNRPLYEALKRVFERYNKKDNANPFLDYVNDPSEVMFKNGYPYVVVSYSVDGKQIRKTVKNLTVLGSLKKENSIIRARGNGNSFYSSMNWLELHLYKKKDGSSLIVPVNAIYYAFVRKNKFSDKIEWRPKQALHDFLKENGLSIEATPFFRLRKGQLLVLNRDLVTYNLKKGSTVYVCGFKSKTSEVEVKPLHRLNTHGSQILCNLKSFLFLKDDSLGIKKLIIS